MKTHEAEAILKYCADIPRRLTIIRRHCAPLDDEVETQQHGRYARRRAAR